MGDSNAPGFSRLISIAWTYDGEVWYSTQGGQLLNRLMCRTIFTNADTIMCENINRFESHQCSQANGGAHIIREDQEGSAKGDQSTIEGHTIEDTAHGVLSDTKVHIAPV